jgi:hypothetical protein
VSGPYAQLGEDGYPVRLWDKQSDVIDYGDRAEHCWNGDHENGNHISRLRYNTMYVPKILKRIEETAPAGSDLTSWRYR